MEVAAQVFDEGQALGFDFDLLDIGGGFPGHAAAPITFEEVSLCLIAFSQIFNVNEEVWPPSKEYSSCFEDGGSLFVQDLTVRV